MMRGALWLIRRAGLVGALVFLKTRFWASISWIVPGIGQFLLASWRALVHGF
jgi:hypothetical protein